MPEWLGECDIMWVEGESNNNVAVIVTGSKYTYSTDGFLVCMKSAQHLIRIILWGLWFYRFTQAGWGPREKTERTTDCIYRKSSLAKLSGIRRSGEKSYSDGFHEDLHSSMAHCRRFFLIMQENFNIDIICDLLDNDTMRANMKSCCW